MFLQHSNVSKMKEAKSLEISTKSVNSSNMHPSGQSKGISTPLVDASLARQSPSFMGSSPVNEDNENPDVIPNQYGEF